jgi:O-antigen ligase
MMIERATRWMPAILLAVAMLLGGGSSLFPANEMIVELVGVAVLTAVLIKWRRDRMGPDAVAPLILLGLLVALVLAQLVPLPPSLWMALPGRELVAETARQIGEAGRWRPISLDPEQTIRTSLALIPPVAMFLAGLGQSTRDHERLLWVVLVMALGGFLLGLLQIVSGGSASLYFYESAHQGLPTGVFANRNHQGALLLVGMLVTATLFGGRPGDRRMAGLVAGALILLFAFGVIATGSRTAAALAPIALIGSALLFFQPRPGRRSWMIGGAVGGLAAAGLGALVAFGGADIFDRLSARFSQDREARFEFWPDVIYAIQQYFPFGSGLGTFETVFRAAERLAIVSTHYVNHAHSDYLEIAVEAGLFGAALVAFFLIWLAWQGFRAWRSDGARLAVRMGRLASIGIVLLMLHCTVDYPLRTISLATVFALLVGLLARSRAEVALETRASGQPGAPIRYGEFA